MNPADPVTIDLVVYVASGISIAVGIVVWVLTQFSRVWRAIDAHRLHTAETYATKTGLKESFDGVHSALSRLADRIDAFMQRSERRENHED